MLPLFSGGFMLISYLWDRMKTNAGYSRWWFYGHGLLVAAVIVLLASQFVGQVQVGFELFMRAVNPI
jgi:NADH:ubiquinone oxidoreductase subunit 6 (subunit J)